MLVTVYSQHSNYSRQLEETATLLYVPQILHVKILWPRFPTVFPVLVTPEYFTCSNTAFTMQFQKKSPTRIAVKSVTVGFKITYYCVISIRSMWHWLYNNNSLSVLYELNGSTHLPSVKEPYPVSMAMSPTYEIDSSIGSTTGRMVSETVKTHVLMQNIWKGFPYVSLILYHYNVILSKKLKKFLQLVAPIFTLYWLLLIEYASQFILLLYLPFYFIIYWSLL